MLINQEILDTYAATSKRFEQRQNQAKAAPKNVESEKLIKPSQVLKQIDYKAINLDSFISDFDTRERVINENDLLPINYFAKGLLSAKAVGRVTIISISGAEVGYGTGFLIGNNLLMTNNHVLETKETAQNSIVEFDYEIDANNTAKTPFSFRLEPTKFFYTSQELDFTIVFVADNSITGAQKIGDYGTIPMIEKVGKVGINSSVSIIQHPKGMRKSISLRNNTITDILDNYLHYKTDTEPGSSGSPVLNDDWELVALHHSGVPKRNEQGQILTKSGAVATVGDDENDIDWTANEGVRVSKILAHLRANVTNAQKLFLREILRFDEGNTPNNTPVVNSLDTLYYDAKSDKKLSKEYYRGIDLSSSTLFETLSELLGQTHKKHLEYKPSKYLYPDIDKHQNGKLMSVYSGKIFTTEELIRADEQVDAERKSRFLELSKNENLIRLDEYQHALEALEASLPYNCEHVVPQSWFLKSDPMKGDLHHLFACESGCNSFRGNMPYFDFDDFEPQSSAEEVVRDSCGKREAKKFEPQFNQGAVARATLYFLLRYPNNVSNNYDQNRLKTLLKWHAVNPVSEYEKRRNMKISLMQGNRNPLIDFPEINSKVAFSKGL